MAFPNPFKGSTGNPLVDAIQDISGKVTVPLKTVAKPKPIVTQKSPAGRAKGESEGPGTSEQFFKNTKDFYTEPTKSNQFYGENEDFYTQPGKTEGLFDQNQGTFFQPGMGETIAGGILPGMNAPGVGQGFAGTAIGNLSGQTGAGNQSQQAWEQFLRNRPDINRDPGLDPYYDNAKRRAEESIRQTMAAKGAYGSSAANDMAQEAFTNLEAEKANREADYHLARLAEQRGWEGLGGQLAGQASGQQLGWTTGLGNLGLGAETLGMNKDVNTIASALGVDATELSRVLGGLGISNQIDTGDLNRIIAGAGAAGQADTMDLSKIIGGQESASTAQNDKMTRIMNAFSQIFGPMSTAMGTAGNAYNDIFSSDTALMDAIFGAGLAGGQQGISNQQYTDQQKEEALSALTGILGLE